MGKNAATVSLSVSLRRNKNHRHPYKKTVYNRYAAGFKKITPHTHIHACNFANPVPNKKYHKSVAAAAAAAGAVYAIHHLLSVYHTV